MPTTAHHTPPGGGVRYEMTDGVHIVKASAEDTCGVFEMFEVLAHPGPAAPPHRSPWSGSLHVLEGTLSAQVEGTTYELTVGATLVIEPLAAFTFWVDGAAARFLAVTTGDGAGRFFADFAANVPAGKPVEEVLPQLLAVTQRHGVSIAAPADGADG
ncbi:cupin domain-containing protein [Streptomyces sp. NPDC051940]|uniref:cupin domain-containing protein n=1 Tax=Streptomyces sp. NPDC051940 TaxID=3155675 RepID=UPI003428A00D